MHVQSPSNKVVPTKGHLSYQATFQISTTELFHLNGNFFCIVEWVSEWLLFNTNSAIFQPYHGENKLILNVMMMRSTLY